MQASLLGSLWRQQGFLLGLLQIQVSLPSFLPVYCLGGHSVALPGLL